MSFHVIFRNLVVIGAVIGFAWWLQSFRLDSIIDREWLVEKKDGMGISFCILFCFFSTMLIFIGFSRLTIAFLAGYIFEFRLAVTLSMLTAISGCVLFVLCFRLLKGHILRNFLEKKITHQKIKNFNTFLKENTFTSALLVRLFPVGSNIVVNSIAALSEVPLVPFFIGSFLGYIPQTLIFVLIGSGLVLNDERYLFVSIFGCILYFFIIQYAYNRHSKFFSNLKKPKNS